MELSKSNNKEKKFFDVHTPKRNSHFIKKKLLNNFFHDRNVLSLRPKFRIRHPLISSLVFLGAIALVLFVIRQLSTRAEVQDFFPTTCLGNWQNVANAEGSPETLNSPNVEFSATNSAIYASGTEIYCGGFVPPSFATSGQITNVGLTLVWQIGDTPTSSQIMASSTNQTSSTVDVGTSSASDDSSGGVTPVSTGTGGGATTVTTPIVATTTSDENTTTITTAPPSTDDSATTGDDATNADSTSTPPLAPAGTSTPMLAPTPTPEPDSDTPADSSNTSFIRQLIPFAFADDVDSGTVSEVETSTSAPVATTTIAATTTPTSSDMNATSTNVVTPTAVPDQNFLDVSYSTDGQTWISIGKVSLSNWQQFTVTLPISDWADFENLQVRVEGIPTTQDPIPPIYLDGMLVEVDYNIPSPILALSSPATATSSVQQTIQVSPNITITQPPAVAIPVIPAPTITGIVKTGDQVAVTVQYVGDFYGSNPLYMFVYPDGTTASRNDADSAFTFAGEPTEGPSINALALTPSQFDPTTKQATVTIVTPITADDSQIATGEMTTGTYDVDISYFDSETWHLIPAQTFTWP